MPLASMTGSPPRLPPLELQRQRRTWGLPRAVSNLIDQSTSRVASVSVIVCSYSEARWTDLVDAVASVHNQTRAPIELLVVVDHNPALLERVQADLAGVIPLANSGPPGLSGARNTGIAAATGDIVVFLDDDAAAAPDWLAHLVAPFDDVRVLGVGGYIDPAWSSPPPTWFPDEFRWVVGCSYRGLPVLGGAVRNLIGANMSFRRTVFDTIGGFRSELGHNGARAGGDEETELCIRLHHRWPDALLVYEPLARVRHHVPDSRATWRYFRTRCFAEGMAKARVSRYVGAADGLASERSYTFSTLPSGVLAALGDVVRRGQTAGAVRAAAITAGLAVTVGGYVVESVRGR
jgi:glycosyltransferase involved in cell wall biosynthesis